MEHSPRAHRGQHFLRRRSARALVEAARICSDDLVVEIGAGTGVITDLLVERARAVVGIESDPRLSKDLIKRFSDYEGVHIVAGDALTFPYPRDTHRVLGNIPFNITTALLRLLLDDPASSLQRADLIVELGAAIKRTLSGRALNVGWGPWWTFRRTRRIPRAEFTPRRAMLRSCWWNVVQNLCCLLTNPSLSANSSSRGSARIRGPESFLSLNGSEDSGRDPAAADSDLGIEFFRKGSVILLISTHHFDPHESCDDATSNERSQGIWVHRKL